MLMRSSSRAPAIDNPSALAPEPTVPLEDADRDILDLVDAGTPAVALRVLMQRHGTSVCRYCREELHDTTLADDVQQQIFLQVHRDIGRFHRRATLRTWLFAIARNRVLDAVKARHRARAHVDDDETADTLDPSPDAGDRIGKLSPQTRTALLLRYQQGFTFEEMSEICHEKPGTLQARVMRALPALRRCIESRTGGKL
jgi:RNA polymerase sigma-70 factor (ECF subfamily)